MDKLADAVSPSFPPFENTLEVRVLKHQKVVKVTPKPPIQDQAKPPISEPSEASEDESLEELNKEIEKMKEKLAEQTQKKKPSKNPKSLNSLSGDEKDDQ